MTTINSLSGGRTSSFMAISTPADYDVFAVVCIEKKEAAPKDVSLIRYVNEKLDKLGYTERFGEFIATAEDDRTLLAVRELEQVIGRDISWVRGEAFDNILKSRTMLPSRKYRFCTADMKVLPIAEWMLYEGLINPRNPATMNIGFRGDELRRIERWDNDSNTVKLHTHSPIDQLGRIKRQWQTFHWRKEAFPLRGYTKQEIYAEMRKYPKLDSLFPALSNCVGCFHKDEIAINLQSKVPEIAAKMQWFMEQEHKGKGTWFDNRIKYSTIAGWHFTSELDFSDAGTCDSGFCTD